MKVLVVGGSGFIGTNLVEYLADAGHAVLSIDKNNPKDPKHERFFQKVNVLDESLLKSTLEQWAPTSIVHLAARTDLLETASLDRYAANIAGVRHFLKACARLSNLKRVVFASSMLVCRNGYLPRSETDYCPNTLYGESKALGEQLVRADQALMSRSVIVRPTSIWGPWFGPPYLSFFRSIERGSYWHIGRHAALKAFGYVGNTVHQIVRLLEAPGERVVGKTFYLADQPPYSIRDWAEVIQREFGARRIREAPLWMLKGIAAMGDGAKRLGWVEPPLTTFRLNNMLTGSQFDLQELLSVIGPQPFTMAQGVARTVEWLRAAPNKLGSVPAQTPVTG